MAGSRSVGLTFLFVLCTFGSGAAQTTAPTILALKPPQRTSQVTLTNDRDRYPATFSEPRDNAHDYLAGSENTPSVAQQVPPLDAQARDHLAQAFLDEKLIVWRQRLKLEDWRISIVLMPRDDLKTKTLGGIRWDKPQKSAVIWVLDASDYRLPFREMLDDMEFTVVHELVHLELASLPRSEASRGTEEYAVNRIAEALLGLDRKR